MGSGIGVVAKVGAGAGAWVGRVPVGTWYYGHAYMLPMAMLTTPVLAMATYRFAANHRSMNGLWK